MTDLSMAKYSFNVTQSYIKKSFLVYLGHANGMTDVMNVTVWDRTLDPTSPTCSTKD